MTNERLVGMWAGDHWDLREYSWRGKCVKSPLNGNNMRAIVARDTQGWYHPGLRNTGSHPDAKTVYEDFTRYQHKTQAIGRAEAMLVYELDAHRQTQAHLAQEPVQRNAKQKSRGIDIS